MSFEFLRGMVGIIGIGCAHMLARALVGVRKGRSKLSYFYGWVLRTIVCLGAVALRHSLDLTDAVIWGLAVAAFAAGWWDASRERKVEDLTKQMFPEEEDKK
ncbi:MAG: hypothetical protein ABSH00_14995 [Bryobacteraceae bacterium]|jgi:hypothetical protein